MRIPGKSLLLVTAIALIGAWTSEMEAQRGWVPNIPLFGLIAQRSDEENKIRNCESVPPHNGCGVVFH